MSKRFLMTLVRSIAWGVGFGLAVAVLEAFSIIVYIWAPGRLESLFVTNLMGFYSSYAAVGFGFGLVCGAFLLVLSLTAWYRRLGDVGIKACERGLVMGLMTFFFLAAVVHKRFFFKPILHPLSIALSVGLLVLSALLALAVELTVSYLRRSRSMMKVVTIAILALVFTTLAATLYLQSEFNLRSFEGEKRFKTSALQDKSYLRPNILLITIDALRADHVSAYGYTRIHTANIDRLKEEGVLFERMIAQSSWTRSSFGSMWTSLYPSQHGANKWNLYEKGKFVKRFDHKLRRDVPTIAELFSKAGYLTLALNTNPTLSSYYGFNRGFNSYIDAINDSDPFDLFAYSVVYDVLEKVFPSIVHDFLYLPADKVYQIFERLIAKLDTEQPPFFFWVHFMDPHDPYFSKKGVRANGKVYHSISLETDIGSFLTEMGDIDKAKDVLVEMYDQEVLKADHYVGRVLDLMERSEFLANTLVVLVSDHGEEFFDHGGRNQDNTSPISAYNSGYGHGHTMYEEQVRVPMIFRFPKKEHAGKKVTSIVQHIDLLPTLLAYAGINVVEDKSRGFEGINLLRYVKSGEEFPERYAKSEYNYRGWELKQVRSKRHKLIYHIIDQRKEFYDLSTDPLEQRDLSGKAEGAYSRLSSELKVWMVAMPKKGTDGKTEESRIAGMTAKEGPEAQDVDERKRAKVMRQLKALGYVQ